MMADGKNVQTNEEITCISLHFLNTKESNNLFVTDLEYIFDVGKRYKDVVILSYKEGKPILIPFKLCAFPMDISAEQKYLDVGSGFQNQGVVLHKIHLPYITISLFLAEFKFGEGV